MAEEEVDGTERLVDSLPERELKSNQERGGGGGERGEKEREERSSM